MPDRRCEEDGCGCTQVAWYWTAPSTTASGGWLPPVVYGASFGPRPPVGSGPVLLLCAEHGRARYGWSPGR